MQFGVQFFPAVDHTDKSAADYYAESLAIAEEAEQLGLHATPAPSSITSRATAATAPTRSSSSPPCRSARRRCASSPARCCRCSIIRSSSRARSRCSTAFRGGRLDVGFARAFLPHEFRRFGISPDESQARFREGLEQVELLLTQENVTHHGEFHSFENVTSLPRPTQTPRPKFYIAATQTPESFEFAGRKGYSLMAIPIGPIGPLLELYRKSWRDAGHPGDGEVMVAFHMFCHEDGGSRARSHARRSRNISARSMRRPATGRAARPPRTIATTIPRCAGCARSPSTARSKPAAHGSAPPTKSGTSSAA